MAGGAPGREERRVSHTSAIASCDRYRPRPPQARGAGARGGRAGHGASRGVRGGQHDRARARRVAAADDLAARPPTGHRGTGACRGLVARVRRRPPKRQGLDVPGPRHGRLPRRPVRPRHPRAARPGPGRRALAARPGVLLPVEDGAPARQGTHHGPWRKRLCIAASCITADAAEYFGHRGGVARARTGKRRPHGPQMDARAVKMDPTAVSSTSTRPRRRPAACWCRSAPRPCRGGRCTSRRCTTPSGPLACTPP